MRRVLTAWDEHLADPHLPCRLLADAGFTVTRRRVHPMLNAGYDPNTFSAGVLDLHHDFVPGRAGVTNGKVAGLASRSHRARRGLLLQPQPLPVPRRHIGTAAKLHCCSLVAGPVRVDGVVPFAVEVVGGDR